MFGVAIWFLWKWRNGRVFDNENNKGSIQAMSQFAQDIEQAEKDTTRLDALGLKEVLVAW